MSKATLLALMSLILLAIVAPSWSDEPSPAKAKPTIAPPTVDEARRQASILHDAMHASLQVVHHRFYREDEGLPLPAATFLEIFAEIEQEQNIKLRWLAVDGVAMNADHKPRDSFEHDAVQALKSGKRSHEQTDHGIYRRAGAITLTNHCLKCHVPDRKSTDSRTAGLIIAIPIQSK
jgi:hypothetical protein